MPSLQYFGFILRSYRQIWFQKNCSSNAWRKSKNTDEKLLGSIFSRGREKLLDWSICGELRKGNKRKVVAEKCCVVMEYLESSVLVLEYLWRVLLPCWRRKAGPRSRVWVFPALSILCIITLVLPPGCSTGLGVSHVLSWPQQCLTRSQWLFLLALVAGHLTFKTWVPCHSKRLTLL